MKLTKYITHALAGLAMATTIGCSDLPEPKEYDGITLEGVVVEKAKWEKDLYINKWVIHSATLLLTDVNNADNDLMVEKYFSGNNSAPMNTPLIEIQSSFKNKYIPSSKKNRDLFNKYTQKGDTIKVQLGKHAYLNHTYVIHQETNNFYHVFFLSYDQIKEVNGEKIDWNEIKKEVDKK